MTVKKTRYTVPTHLNLPDKLLFGLTARQVLLLLIGISTSYHLWVHLAGLAVWGLWGEVLRIVLLLPLLLSTLLVAWVQLAHRPLEHWIVIALQYLVQPKVLLWHRTSTPPSRRKTHHRQPPSL